jgi:hypothetical protein
MSLGPNPLVVLGIPVWLVEHELALGSQGLERLKAHIARVVRSARQLYHDDLGGRWRDPKLLALIDAAAQELEDTSVVRHYARQLLNPTGSAHTAQAQQLARQDGDTAHRRLQALMSMIGYVDSAAVLCADNVEVVLGNRQVLVDDEFISHGTYALELGAGGLGMLYRLHHPVVGGMPAVMSYLEPPTWDEASGTWLSEYVHREEGGVAELRIHSFLRSELFGVRLVGGLSLADARALARRPQAGTATRELMGGAASEDLGDLVWYTAEYAWWLEGMRAPVNVGDVPVLVNDATGLMALAGKIVALRFLEP